MARYNLKNPPPRSTKRINQLTTTITNSPLPSSQPLSSVPITTFILHPDNFPIRITRRETMNDHRMDNGVGAILHNYQTFKNLSINPLNKRKIILIIIFLNIFFVFHTCAYWVTIDPIPDTPLGSTFCVRGTTNIPVGGRVNEVWGHSWAEYKYYQWIDNKGDITEDGILSVGYVDVVQGNGNENYWTAGCEDTPGAGKMITVGEYTVFAAPNGKPLNTNGVVIQRFKIVNPSTPTLTPTPFPTTRPTTYPTQTSSYSESTSSSSGSGKNDSAILIIGIIVIIGVVGLIGFKLIKRDSPSPPTEQLQKTPTIDRPQNTYSIERVTEDTLNKIQPHIDRLVQNQLDPLDSINKFYSFLELEGFTLTPELKNVIVKKIREARDAKVRDTKKQQISSELFEKKETIPVKESITLSPQSPVSPFTPKPVTPKQLPQELSDRYTESEFIGKGGFARVFKAKRKDGKYVAVKIPISLDASTGKSFIAEMQNWTKLEHSNIVRVFDYNIMPMPYFEMELCDGSLAEMKKPVECEEAAWIIFNVCEGLKFTHSRSIIHRDLKPQNILLKNGIPKISDWGLSKVVSESTSTTTTSFTPYYAAPEQINSKHKDERTDIWQLGVILYELCTGVLPFRGDSVVEIAVNIATKDPQRPNEIVSDAQPIESVIMKCLEKDPLKRYQTVLELQKDLAMYLRENYTDLLKTSVTVQDYNQSAYYCGDLVMINLLTGDIPTAYKYLLDLVHYSKGDVKAEAQELSEQIKMRMEMGVTEISDELIQKAEIVVHQVSLHFRK